MMALNLLPSNVLASQSSFISLQQSSTRAVNRRSCANMSHIGGAVLIRGVLLNHEQGKSSLQAHTSCRSVIEYPELGGRIQRRGLTRCSAVAPLDDEKEKVLTQEDANVMIASPPIETLAEMYTSSITQESSPASVQEPSPVSVQEPSPVSVQEPSPVSVPQQPRKTGGGRGGGGLQWILGPLALLVTGAIPALWLPLPALFSGTAIAGLLALTGLDATFNMGATAFLLMANSSASSNRDDSSLSQPSIIPRGYKIWSFLVNLVGLVAPIALVLASLRGVLELQPSVQVLPAAALLGPYTLLLLVQWLGEAMVWEWRSPVWPVLPLVYQAYRLLQLTRGLELGVALDAPAWLVEAVKGLIAWWVFVLGMQIMWVSWLVGTIQTGTARSTSS